MSHRVRTAADDVSPVSIRTLERSELRVLSVVIRSFGMTGTRRDPCSHDRARVGDGWRRALMGVLLALIGFAPPPDRDPHRVRADLQGGGQPRAGADGHPRDPRRAADHPARRPPHLAVLLAVVVVTLDRPLCRRVLGLAASALTLVVTVNLSLDFAFAGAVFVWPAVIPHSVQWPLVALAPAVVLLVSALVIRLREQDGPAQVA
jgi:hypothetical protein